MHTSTEKFYNRFSFLYPLIDVLLKSQKSKLMQEVNNMPAGKLLEIGVGIGRHLPSYTDHDVVGIDISAAMLNTAQKYKKEKMELLQMDGEGLLFSNNSFDYVVIAHVIAVTSRPNLLIDEAFRVLKPNGKLIILNHFTPKNGLKYIDIAFHAVSRLLSFHSLFYLHQLTSLVKFSLVKKIAIGKLSYFKLLIYSKP